jgi:hypothetical protein
VILPAVQSLRLACMEGAGSENAELGLSAPRGGLGEGGRWDDGTVGSQAKGGSFSVDGGRGNGFCELSRTALS